MLREAILAIVLCCLVITGCSASQNVENILPTTTTTGLTFEQPNGFSEENTPITIKMTFAKIPRVNEETTLHVEVSSIFDAYGTNVKIILPPESEVISGTIDKKIDLKANILESFDTKIKITRAGDYKIIAKALKVHDQENSWGNMDVHYIKVNNGISTLNSDKPVLSSQMEKAGSSTPQRNTGTVTASYDLNNKSFSPATPPDMYLDSKVKPAGRNNAIQNSPNTTILGIGTLTVRGNFNYYTKVVGGSLADYRDNDDTLVPLRRAFVRILSPTGVELGWTYTDNNGDFEVAITNPYPSTFNVEVYSWNRYADPGAVSQELRVIATDTSMIGFDYVYSAYLPQLTTTDGTHVQDVGSWYVTKGSNSEHAFMIFQDLIRAREFIGWDVGTSSVLWYPTSTDGSYYVSGGNIHLKGEDYLSGDTVIHEFGHNYMWSKKGTWINTCPNPHYIQLAYTQQCGYTEGWANFLALVVNDNPIKTWSDGSMLNLETPTWGTANWANGDACNGRVAGALWDIYDSASDGNDQYQFAYALSDLSMKQNYGWTFADFWNAWRSSGYSTNAGWSIYQNTINYMSGGIENAVVRKTFQFGKTGDVAVSGDWDGNGIQDVGIFRPSNGNWYLANNDGIMLMSFSFGKNGDIPIIGDWDHNGVSDIGVFRPSNGNWYLDTTKTGVVNRTFHFGTSGDLPVVKDWNSDGASDLGVFRQSSGIWYFNYTPM